ncbi:MAG: ribonuclease P protein component [Bacteroidia bacterium]|nr:ribonuclease P protein component [Bacteroidia bacterium]
MDVLFAQGKHAQQHPIKIIYLETLTPLDFQAQAMFVVPKRIFKKAHDRNKLKRRMKEAYRLEKNNFYAQLQSQNKKVVLAFIYTGKAAEDFNSIQKALLKLLGKIMGAKSN